MFDGEEKNVRRNARIILAGYKTGTYRLCMVRWRPMTSLGWRARRTGYVHVGGIIKDGTEHIVVDRRYACIISQSSNVKCNATENGTHRNEIIKKNEEKRWCFGTEQAKVVLKWSVRFRAQEAHRMRMATFREIGMCVRGVMLNEGWFRVLDGWRCFYHMYSVRCCDIYILLCRCCCILFAVGR